MATIRHPAPPPFLAHLAAAFSTQGDFMRPVLIILLALAAAGFGGGASAQPAAQNFAPSDLFGLQRVIDPQIRPDGRSIVYVRESFDIQSDRGKRSIWLVDAGSGAQQEIDTGGRPAGSPLWAPDGKRLAYIVNKDGRSQLMVRQMDDGRTIEIADLKGISDPSWAPDGKSIAFIMRTSEPRTTLGSAPPKPEGALWAKPLTIITSFTYRLDGQGYLERGYLHAFVVPADGGPVRQVTSGAYDHSGPIAWTPDARNILLSADRTATWERFSSTSQIYQVRVADGAMIQLTRSKGPATTPRMSPDGRKIAYRGYDNRMVGHHSYRVRIMERDGGNDRPITATLDRSISDLQWASDSKSLFVQYIDRAVPKIARLKLDGSLSTVVEGLAGSQLDRPYTLGGAFSLAGDGTIAYASGSDDAPADLSVVRDGRVKRLTTLNEALLAGKTLGDTMRLPVRSSLDQREIDAWMVTPPGFDPKKKYPLILEIHGGPYASYATFFSTDFQLYAAAGYIVLYANPRGSTSYGEEFANLIQGDYPGPDYHDLMSAVDAAIATGHVDPDQLFVTGGSGGGTLTAWIVGKTQRFRAAATQKPIINYTSYVLTTDEASSVPQHWFGKMPWEDPEGYWRRSPLALVGNVTTPTLVVVGAEDYRTPVSDSEQYYQALQLRGVPTGLVLIPDAGHLTMTARPSQSAARVSAILAWFERFRQAPWTPEGASPLTAVAAKE